MSLRADVQTDVQTDVRRVREQFLCKGSLEAETSPPSVLDSWRRSQALHLDPDRVELPDVREPNTGSRLARAATPVLQRVADDLAAHTVGVLLTSTDGVVVERTAQKCPSSTRSTRQALHRAIAWLKRRRVPTESAPRWRLAGPHSSVAVSTTSRCGSVSRARGRRSVTHNARIIGVVNLSCLSVQSDPLLLALASSAAHQIEDRMRVVAHEGETALLEAYLQQARRSSNGVLAIGGDVVLMNPYLRRTLHGNDQTALLEHASDLVSSTLSGTALAVLPSGRIAKITAADRSTICGGRTNVVFHVDLSSQTSSQRPKIARSARTRIPGLAGRDGAWLRCCQGVRQCCSDRHWVMIEGEKGSGRARLARAVGSM